MSILRLAAQIFLIYLLYRLVVNFAIPTYRAVRKFRKQFHQMQEGMGEQFQQNGTQPKPEVKTETKSTTVKEGEYIEFEEVKD